MKETKDEERPARITHAVVKKALAAQGADPSSGHMLLVTQKKKAPAAQVGPRAGQVKIDVMNYV